MGFNLLKSASDAVHSVQHAASQAVHNVQHATSQAVQGVQHAASSATHAVQSTVSHAAQSAQHAAAQAVHGAQSTFSNTVHATRHAVHNFQNATTQAVHNVQHSASQLTHNVQNATTQAVHNVQHSASQWAHNVQHATTQAVQVTKSVAHNAEQALKPSTKPPADQNAGERVTNFFKGFGAGAVETVKSAGQLVKDLNNVSPVNQAVGIARDLALSPLTHQSPNQILSTHLDQAKQSAQTLFAQGKAIGDLAVNLSTPAQLANAVKMGRDLTGDVTKLAQQGTLNPGTFAQAAAQRAGENKSLQAGSTLLDSATNYKKIIASGGDPAEIGKGAFNLVATLATAGEGSAAKTGLNVAAKAEEATTVAREARLLSKAESGLAGERKLIAYPDKDLLPNPENASPLPPKSPVPKISEKVSPTRLVPAPAGNPKFYGVRNNNGGVLWSSKVPVNAKEVEKLARDLRSQGSVRIVTGTHGTQTGGLVAEPKFFKEDIQTVKADGRNGMGARDINQMSPEALKRWANSPNQTILGWCYSDRFSELNKLLEAGQPK